MGRNFERDVVGAYDPDALALIEIDRSGARTEWAFGRLRSRAGALAGRLLSLGLRQGDVVMTLIGNRPQWAASMLACFRAGFVVLACTEQLRAKDLALRLSAARVAAVIADDRDRDELTAAKPDCHVLWISDESIWNGATPPHVEPAPHDPALMTFTSGTSGPPRCVVHGTRYVWGQSLQTEHWLDVRAGDIVWCTAASGWSKSARNAFLAPWLRGGVALLFDGRFDPSERFDVIASERVNVLCMAPTEYRAIAAKASLRRLSSVRSAVAAGELLDPAVQAAWRDAAGLNVRDGYGQSETGQVTGVPPDAHAPRGTMGRTLPGVEAWVDDGELVIAPATLPTFFLNYLGEEAPRGPWRTGDRVRQDGDGWFYFEGRADDIIVSSGYRIGPFEVESALLSHPAVAEAAVVAHPDEERGSVVRAVVVLRAGHRGDDVLARSLQEHVKRVTAPYKYPRVVEFVPSLPKTASGKIRRAALRR